jgi:GT2 family glycosyltransferase
MSNDELPTNSLRRMFSNLPRRIRLTLEYEGLSGFVRKSLRFLLRLTPLRRFLSADAALRDMHSKARAWYRKNARPVTVVIAAYGAPDTTVRTVRSVRQTTSSRRVHVVVVDDGSPPDVQASLRERVQRAGAEVLLGGENVGYAANVNRALEPLARSADRDVVLLNNDVVAHRGWLELLQYAAYQSPKAGIVGPKLLYPDNSIQFAGAYRNLGAPDWFDHRFRFKPADFGPANVPGPVLGVTGACVYIKAETLGELGALDRNFPMAFEDVDYCLRAWDHGRRVIYYPAATLSHLESKTRGTVQGKRELASKNYFWRKWGLWFERRPVAASPGRLRIVYVSQDTGVGGGHRVVFEHLNRLAERGHEVALYTLDDSPPDWFDLRVPVKSFRNYERLVEDLVELEAIKVATWWQTAEPVWLASVRKGIPVYFVQDIETSYYRDAVHARNAVLASYRPEFRYLTTSSWNRERLAEMGYSAALVSPGVDLLTYRPLALERNKPVILAVGRSHYLKNLELTVEAWRLLPEPRPELWLFGIEPELGSKYGVRYFTAPSDEQVNELQNQVTAFVQTSRHEGYCLPLIEAMAAGTPVVCTDAHGNRDFCVDRVNCLMADSEPASMAASLREGLSSEHLRESLSAGGRRTAIEHEWEKQIGALESFFVEISEATLAGEPART